VAVPGARTESQVTERRLDAELPQPARPDGIPEQSGQADHQWRYSVEKLKDREPFTIACYIAALAHKEHPDEERAREILEEPVAEQELEGAPLWAMIDSLEATFNQMDEEIEKRGA
jgi:hypothetical protein